MTTNFTDVRKGNCKRIYEALYKSEGLTLLDIEQSTGLSRPTVVGIVRAMEEVKLVISLGKRESNGGRTPLLYGINPEAYYAIGVDFEFPVSRIAVSNLKGEIVSSSKKEFSSSLSATQTIEELINQLLDLVNRVGIDETKYLGIGMGMPGYINLKAGVSRRFERIADWKNIEIVEIISRRMKLPVFMENDVHLLFRAERELWKRKNNQDALFIAIRSGIGSAIFQRGHIIEGEFGNAGHVGHTVIQVSGKKCRCGNYGCLELYASERAIREAYAEQTGNPCTNIEEVVSQAIAGKQAAISVLKKAGEYLGIGIGNMINLTDINTIIISSSFDSMILLHSAQHIIDERINIPQERKAVIYPSRLTERDYALGGCKLVLQRNKDEILSTIPLRNL